MNTPPIVVARESVLQHVRTAVLMTVVLTLALGIVYPLVMTGISQVLFNDQANGSLIRDRSGTIVGSALLGQNFAQPQYFHPRPSAAGSDGYDATASGGSNFGPTNQKLIDAVQQRTQDYRTENGLADDALVPVDAVTTSASGLDPDISPANAQLQISRVATARGLSVDQVKALVDRNTEGRVLFVMGEPRVNVLELNLALDALGKR